jgi:glycosyltransferase involved in cell wall biosynthesis
MTVLSEARPAPHDQPLRVALLRGIPECVGPSVRQFADALETGFAHRPDVELRSLVLHELGLVRQLSRGSNPRLLAGAENVLDSFVRYPLSIRRATGTWVTVFHIIDQWYGHLAAFVPRQRTVVSCQDLILAKYHELDTDHRPPRRDRVRFAASIHYLDRVAHVVCSTHAVKSDLTRSRGVAPERISVVAKGVPPQMRPLDRSREALRATLPGRPGPIVLHVSTGWPYKNVAGTLHVLAALRERGLTPTLLRVGIPLTTSENALAKRLRLTPWIIELGTIDQQRLVEVYNLADVLLFPSLDEGFGRPPVEAMACGTPVVTSTAPALIEVVGDAGLHAGANDAAGLARAVEAVLGDPGLAAGLRARGLERASRYTWDATVQAYAAVYEQVARGAGRDPGAHASSLAAGAAG